MLNGVFQSEVLITKDIQAIPSQNRILVKGEEHVVQPKVMQLLVLLCKSQGETLSKQQLNDAIWPGLVVSQESLANIVARLRRVLNDNVKNPTYVETVQGIGYRWIQPLQNDEPFVKKHAAAFVFAIASVVILSGIAFWVYTPSIDPNPKLSDLKITPTAEGVEISVGLETSKRELNKEQVLEEVKQLTGLDATADQVEIKIEKDPVIDHDDQKQRDENQRDQNQEEKDQN